MAMTDNNLLPKRKFLPHSRPIWVSEKAIYFITICAEQKGINSFCKKEVSDILIESVLYREKIGQWFVYYFLLMPDHIHGLFSFNIEHKMKDVLFDWKRYVSVRTHIAWQRDFFDHRLRSKESLSAKIEYISMNPVRKGLVAKSEEWPYSWYFR